MRKQVEQRRPVGKCRKTKIGANGKLEGMKEKGRGTTNNAESAGHPNMEGAPSREPMMFWKAAKKGMRLATKKEKSRKKTVMANLRASGQQGTAPSLSKRRETRGIAGIHEGGLLAVLPNSFTIPLLCLFFNKTSHCVRAAIESSGTGSWPAAARPNRRACSFEYNGWPMKCAANGRRGTCQTRQGVRTQIFAS